MTNSLEDYLETIYLLVQTNGHARVRVPLAGSDQLAERTPFNENRPETDHRHSEKIPGVALVGARLTVPSGVTLRIV